MKTYCFVSGQLDKVFVLMLLTDCEMFKTLCLTSYGATVVTGSSSSNSTNSLSAKDCVWSGLSPVRIE